GEVSPCGLTGDADEVAQFQAPQSYRPIISTGNNPATILRKTDMLHARLVPSQNDGRCSRIQRIPEKDRAILAGRHQPPAVGAKRYRCDSPCLPDDFYRFRCAGSLQFKQLQRLVPGAERHPAIIGTESRLKDAILEFHFSFFFRFRTAEIP